jgi:hypothetical protein
MELSAPAAAPGSSQRRHRWASGIFGGDERDRCCSQSARGRWSPQQSRGEFASAVSATRTGDAAVSKSEDTAEVQLSSRPGPQPIQSGAPSRHEAKSTSRDARLLWPRGAPLGRRASLASGRVALRVSEGRYFDDAAQDRAAIGAEGLDPRTCTHMLDFEPNASRCLALEPRRLMHILGWRTPLLPRKAEAMSSKKL